MSDLPLWMFLILIVYPLLLLLPTVATQSLALVIKWLKLYAQRVFVLSQLLGNVTGIAPEGKIVGFDRGRVGGPPFTLPSLLLLALA